MPGGRARHCVGDRIADDQSVRGSRCAAMRTDERVVDSRVIVRVQVGVIVEVELAEKLCQDRSTRRAAVRRLCDGDGKGRSSQRSRNGSRKKMTSHGRQATSRGRSALRLG